MKTPIFDFVSGYIQNDPLRLHMPGHKGRLLLGCEDRDITEIDGADSLYEASGIIAESERNAGKLFGANTFYSTEGSSHCIRAMLFPAKLHAEQQGKKPLILAARNVHRSFLSACALLDLSVEWLWGADASYLSCRITPEQAEEAILRCKPAALYVTSPDYLGNLADISALSKVCKKYGVLLLVDNAHGAYLKFLPQSLHPMDLGADLCCDSAHKTLPALTGAAYLHIAKTAPPVLRENAKRALALFGSTSPSYLILQSLDLTNRYLEILPELLQRTLPEIAAMKARLQSAGWQLAGDEPLKLTLLPKAYGYTGTELAALLQKENIFCEFADPEHLVMMLSPQTELARLETSLSGIERKAPLTDKPPALRKPIRRLPLREAMLAPQTMLPIWDCLGRTLGETELACPPAVPILVAGEEIDETALRVMDYYGIKQCSVTEHTEG